MNSETTAYTSQSGAGKKKSRTGNTRPRVLFTDAFIMEYKQTLLRIIKVLDDTVLSGMSLRRACIENDMDYVFLTRLLNNKTITLLGKEYSREEKEAAAEEDSCDFRDVDTLALDGYERLYREICGRTMKGEHRFLLPQDYVETADAVLRLLPDKQRQVLEMRCGLDGSDPMTLEEAGHVLGLTRERARQLEKSAVAFLRQPPQSARLTYGDRLYRKQQDSTGALMELEYELLREQIRAEEQDCRDTHAPLSPEEGIRSGLTPLTDRVLQTIPVSELGLSNRASHCLQGGGVNTVYDLLQLPDGALLNMEHLGRKTYDEIMRKSAVYRKRAAMPESAAASDPG